MNDLEFPVQPDARDEGILSSMMGEADPPVRPQEREPDPPPAQKPRTTGLQPMITKLRKELEEIEDRLTNQKTNGAYLKKGEDGIERFDYQEERQDDVRARKLTREIAELEAREREHVRTAQSREAKAWKIANEVFKENAGQFPAPFQKTLGQLFIAIFRDMSARGEWAKPAYADEGVIRQMLMNAYDTAEGNLTRRVRRGEIADLGAPAASGLTQDHQKPKDDKKDDDVDPDDPFPDYTRQVMAAHAKVKGRQKLTFAEAKRLQTEQAAGKGNG